MSNIPTSLKPFVLSEADCSLLGCSPKELMGLILELDHELKPYIYNAGRRLQEVEWLTHKVEEDVQRTKNTFFSEGLLALQIFLLVSCADALGRKYTPGTPTDRIKAFFGELTSQDRQKLIESFYVWKTDQHEMMNYGLLDTTTPKTITRPSYSQILTALKQRSETTRFTDLVDYLIAYRDWYAHEADFPQTGYQPTLAVLQAHRLGVVSLKEEDRIQDLIYAKKQPFLFTML